MIDQDLTRFMYETLRPKPEDAAAIANLTGKIIDVLAEAQKNGELSNSSIAFVALVAATAEGIVSTPLGANAVFRNTTIAAIAILMTKYANACVKVDGMSEDEIEEERAELDDDEEPSYDPFDEQDPDT